MLKEAAFKKSCARGLPGGAGWLPTVNDMMQLGNYGQHY
jgi:hypothetical protein